MRQLSLGNPDAAQARAQDMADEDADGPQSSALLAGPDPANATEITFRRLLFSTEKLASEAKAAALASASNGADGQQQQQQAPFLPQAAKLKHVRGCAAAS